VLPSSKVTVPPDPVGTTFSATTVAGERAPRRHRQVAWRVRCGACITADPRKSPILRCCRPCRSLRCTCQRWSSADVDIEAQYVFDEVANRRQSSHPTKSLWPSNSGFVALSASRSSSVHIGLHDGVEISLGDFLRHQPFMILFEALLHEILNRRPDFGRTDAGIVLRPCDVLSSEYPGIPFGHSKPFLESCSNRRKAGIRSAARFLRRAGERYRPTC